MIIKANVKLFMKKFSNLDTNKENEIELKNNSLAFLKRIIDDEFDNPN